MPNSSKINDSRFWKRWEIAGAVPQTICLTPTKTRDSQRKRLSEIEQALHPLLNKLRVGFNDFLDRATPLRLQRVSKVSGVPHEEILASAEIVSGWRSLGLLDQDFEYARRYIPGDLPDLLAFSRRIEGRIDAAFDRLAA